MSNLDKWTKWYQKDIKPWAVMLKEHGTTHTISSMIESYGATIKPIAMNIINTIQILSSKEIKDVDEPELRIWVETLKNDLLYYAAKKANSDSHHVSNSIRKKHRKKQGYIYLIQAIVPETYYKIGLSVNPTQRINSMGVKLPFPIETIHTFTTNDMYRTEKHLHDKYSKKRVNGEWFELTRCDVKWICSIESWEW